MQCVKKERQEGRRKEKNDREMADWPTKLRRQIWKLKLEAIGGCMTMSEQCELLEQNKNLTFAFVA